MAERNYSNARTERSRNPRGEGHRLREELIEAASELLARGTSEEALSLRAVAREVGIAPTSIYLHFRDKEEILWEVSEARFRELGQHMDEMAAQASSPAEELRARAMAYCRYGLDHPHHYRVLFGSEPIEKAKRSLSELPGGWVFEGLRDSFARALAAGEAARTEDPFLSTVLLWATLHGLVTLRASKPQFPWPSIEQLVDAALETYIGVTRA
jgi:AcrR family transcriptional regulator